MATSCTDFVHPYYKEISEKGTKGCYDFFVGEDAKRMKFVSLGEALDFISNGGGNFVYYSHGTKEITNFIKIWIENQKPKIEYKRIEEGKGCYKVEEASREYSYLWNKFHQHYRMPELPRINYQSCPLDKNHKEVMMDRGGRLRCVHQKHFDIKPSFTNISVGEGFGTAMKRYDFMQYEPDEPYNYNEEADEDYTDVNSPDYKEYIIKKDKFDSEKPIRVVDTCYSIIKEPKNFYLSLESVLNRLNCSHEENTIHPFSGFALADYVQAWWEQQGDKKYFDRTPVVEVYRKFADFVPIGTDD